MANTVKPSADETLKYLESFKSPGAHIIEAINNVINSSLEANEQDQYLQEQISKVCPQKNFLGKTFKICPYVSTNLKVLT